MKRHLILLSLWLLSIFFLFTVSSSTASEPQEGTSPKSLDFLGAQDEADMSLIAKRLADYFPPVEGRVVAVVDRHLKIDVGKKAGLAKGMRLSVFRKGKEFYHPVTKQVLGRMEESLGTVEVEGISDDSAIVRRLDTSNTAIRPGDGVRITKAPIRLAIVTAKGSDEDIINMLAEILEGTERFNIKFTPDLPQKTTKELVEESIKKRGGTIGADAVLFVETEPTGTKIRVNTSLYWASDGTYASIYKGEVDLAALKRLAEEESIIPLRKDHWKDIAFNFRARLLVIGDFDGDGKKEVAISDGIKIKIYRPEKGELVEIWSDKDDFNNNHIALDVGDINKDGKDEIFVTNWVDGILSSYVIEYVDGGYKRIWEKARLFFRVLALPEKGMSLIAQESGTAEPYGGMIYEYHWKDRRYIRKDALKLPRDITSIYGFAYIDWNKTNSYQIITIDNDDYLNLYSIDGSRIWKSTERYGGATVRFDTTFTAGGLFGETVTVMVTGRILVKDSEDGKRQEAIIIKNIPMTYIFKYFKGYKEAEVYGFWWNGSQMAERWFIKKINGVITDYQIADIFEKGKKNLMLLTNPTLRMITGKKFTLRGVDSIFASRSNILMYFIPN
ncbi:MAG: VCBS repeat-containing protein [Nitrospirota bacterium]